LAFINQKLLFMVLKIYSKFYYFRQICIVVLDSSGPHYGIHKGINADPDPAIYSTTSITFYRTYLKETLVLFFYNLPYKS